MKTKTTSLRSLISLLMLCLLVSPVILAQQVVPDKAQQRSIIPPAVKAAMEAGKTTQTPRLDVPFSILKNIYLPAQYNMHNVFFFKVKNADLGYADSTKAEGAEEQEVSSFETVGGGMQANAHIFLQFTRTDGDFVKEVYVPCNLKYEGEYDPEKEEIYSFGYPLPPGNYLLTMAVTSKDFQKIGLQYATFSTPNPMESTDMDTTPIFFIKKSDRLASPERTTEVHKDYFTYSILKVFINMDNTYNVGENLDIFYFILGAQRTETGRFDLAINFAVYEGADIRIKWPEAKFDNPLIMQPLPLKQTVITTETDAQGKETKKTEVRDLAPGNYSLVIDMKDNITGKTLQKKIDFTIVGSE